MDYLLDSNAVSDLSAGHSKLSACVSSVRAPDRVLTCTIVRGEMLFGLAKMPVGKRRNSIELRVHDALRGLPCEPIPASAADAYAEIKTARRRLGLPHRRPTHESPGRTAPRNRYVRLNTGAHT